MRNNKKEVLSRTVFYTLLMCLPLNLGYHFILKTSYLHGILIDYLVPVLYVQDILAVIFVLLNFSTIKNVVLKADKFLIWFLFAVLLSTISSAYPAVSLSYFVRLLVYVLTMLIAKEKYGSKEAGEKMYKIAAVWIVGLSVLAILQWVKQGSVFDNYLFLGEQPYNISTPGIIIENFFDVAKVPPYGTFRHPNIFGGLLSVTLVWMLFLAQKSSLGKLALILGLPALFLTLSKFSWLSFLLGGALYLLMKANKGYVYKAGLIGAGIVVALALTIPFWPNISAVKDKPSFYRRAYLLQASYKLVKVKPLFGLGYGTSTAYIDKYLPPRHDLRFAQPPHNIFVLLLTEAGVFSLLFFALYFFKRIKEAFKNPLIFISLLQVIFLGMFDHYFFTIQQTQLLMWMLLVYA